MSGVLITIALTFENREVVDLIKFAYGIKKVEGAVNKALAYIAETDPNIKRLKRNK